MADLSYQQGELSGKFDMLYTEVRDTLKQHDLRIAKLEHSAARQGVIVGIIVTAIVTITNGALKSFIEACK